MELVERLRYLAKAYDGWDGNPEHHALVTEAADLLEEALKALEPFAEIAHGEVWEKFISDSRMTLRISNGGGDRHLTFVNAECFQEARTVLTKSQGEKIDG